MRPPVGLPASYVPGVVQPREWGVRSPGVGIYKLFLCGEWPGVIELTSHTVSKRGRSRETEDAERVYEG